MPRTLPLWDFDHHRMLRATGALRIVYSWRSKQSDQLKYPTCRQVSAHRFMKGPLVLIMLKQISNEERKTEKVPNDKCACFGASLLEFLYVFACLRNMKENTGLRLHIRKQCEGKPLRGKYCLRRAVKWFPKGREIIFLEIWQEGLYISDTSSIININGCVSSLSHIWLSCIGWHL